MATPESLVKALAQGLIEALLATEEKGKKERPVVVKTDAVKAAVREYIDQLQQQTEPEPQQQDLFEHPPDMGEMIYNRVNEARARAAAQDEDVQPPGTYSPDNPDQARTWQSPIQ